ncbi:stalk domain-containing protein [Desulfitibacter alkalitolerans]|uniref:stalk domain-containing protein n=1 Tax=Desulfitibacter alkalitolerans TaxID=264641 RepID=UPI0004814B39|nr:NPCBM/NEW2 domain-containing protein [Desulfitibacter alkalitolerans]
MKKLLIVIIFLAFLFLNHSSLLASGWMLKEYKGMTGGIKILVNGVQVETEVEPFILPDEGVTMVSLRDLSEALGFNVDWNDITNTISITGNMVSKTYTWDGKAKKRIEDLKVIRNVGPFYEKKINNYQIAGRFFGSGIAVDMEADDKTEFVLDLNRKYSTLDGYFGIDDTTMNSLGSYKLRILGDDRELFLSDLVKPSDYPRYIYPGRIDLTYINRLTIRIDWEEQEIGDYDQLTAVLANFNFYEK